MTTPDPEVSSGDKPKRAGYAPGSLKAISERGQQKEREAERSDATEDLADRHAAGQLVLWPESERGIPNELVRCAVFSAKNRKEQREVYRANAPLTVPVIGGGEVIYTGEELRQDNETVWMQLVHMSKESRSPVVHFTPYSFFKSMKGAVQVGKK